MLVACVHADETSAAAAATTATPEATAGIVIGEQSNVCVTVHVDQSLWPQPLGPDSAQIFSGSLMAELRNSYERRGGSIRFQNSRKHRFVTNESGTHSDCQDRETDVFVVAHYGPRRDGTPFVFEYRIGRGSVTRSDRIEVDVAAEIRAGRIRGFTQRRTMTQVIYEDMLLSRAPVILDQLTILRD